MSKILKSSLICPCGQAVVDIIRSGHKCVPCNTPIKSRTDGVVAVDWTNHTHKAEMVRKYGSESEKKKRAKKYKASAHLVRSRIRKQKSSSNSNNTQ